LRKAQDFLTSTSGYGGTEMMTAIKAALEPSNNQSHVRIVCFMTDGFVGNDREIIAEVQKHSNARVFAFGIGSSVNRFLLDKIAEAGRGDVEYVALTDDGSAAAKRFHQRVRNPLLTDISIDWNDLPVADIYPRRIPDLFGAKPVIVTGRFTAPGSGTIRLKGKMGGNDFTREMSVTLPETMALHDVLAPLWARARVDDLTGQDFVGAQNGKMLPALKNTVTQLGMEFRLMTQFTSFVAVEEMTVTDGGQLRKIDVPVEVPEGVDRSFAYGNVGGPTGLPTVHRKQATKIQGFVFMGGPPPKPMPTVTSDGTNKTGSGVGAAGGGGRPTKSATVINTAPGVTVSAGVVPTPGTSKSPEEQRYDRVKVKVHPALLALIDRLKQKEEPQASIFRGFVRDGKAEVQVWFTGKPDALRLKLKEMGFEIVFDSPNSSLMIGRLPVEKIELLADLELVRYVAPQISK
jgi:Ca-activated chloride channel family protein